MKRLFVVTHKEGWTDTDTINNGWHTDKSSAKAHRDRLNAGLASRPYKVSRGPDHDGRSPAPHKRNSRFRRLRGTR